MSNIQNQEPKVENKLVPAITNKVVSKAADTIFNEIVNLESITKISENIADNLAIELKNATFFTEELELSGKQKEKIESLIKIVATRSKDQYLEQISKDQRTKKQVEIIKLNLDKIIEQTLSSISREVNRGIMINSLAVAADCKNDKHNKVELQYSKFAGDITIPTNCILISTNCLELIKNSILADKFDPETGEVA